MDDNRIPELTLEPDAVPTQTAESTEIPTLATAAEQAAAPVAAGPDLSVLTEAEQKAVKDFVQKIDLSNSAIVLQYGLAAQKNIASFSESALNSVRTKDMGEVGDMISNLVVETLR